MSDDVFLKPFLDDDPYLRCLDRFACDDDDDWRDDGDDGGMGPSGSSTPAPPGPSLLAPGGGASSKSDPALWLEVQQLRDKLSATQNKLALASNVARLDFDSLATGSRGPALPPPVPGASEAEGIAAPASPSGGGSPQGDSALRLEIQQLRDQLSATQSSLALATSVARLNFDGGSSKAAAAQLPPAPEAGNCV